MLFKLLIPAYILVNLLGVWGIKSLLKKRLKSNLSAWFYSISLSLSLTFIVALGVVVYLLQHLR
ncbi:MAG: hypothetical protein NT021_04125 [Sphingobacteriales bacterium]|nr:hypothetical protein [Sphingobacteriales bacterium]